MTLYRYLLQCIVVPANSTLGMQHYPFGRARAKGRVLSRAIRCGANIFNGDVAGTVRSQILSAHRAI